MIEKLQRFPFILVTVAYLGYLGFQYYEFQYLNDGKFAQHQIVMKDLAKELEGLRLRLTEGKKFIKVFDLKKQELKRRSQKLTEYQGVLSDALDVPSLIKLLLTEAKKIQIKVEHIEPGRSTQKEFYLEQEFKLDIKGNYSQMVLLAQRISQLQRVLRIESFNLKPVNELSSQLLGQLSIRAYQYSTSKEDTMGKGIN